MLTSAARLKLPVLPQVGPIYIGMWVIFTSVLTDSPEFDLDVYYTAIGRAQLRATSLNDNPIRISKIIVNDGQSQCQVLVKNLGSGEFANVYYLPRRLNYMESAVFTMTDPCRLKDVTFITDQGNASYTFD